MKYLLFIVCFGIISCGSQLKQENEKLKNRIAELEQENVHLKFSLKDANETITKLDQKATTSEEAKKAKITTKVDGTDVKRVNLWNSIASDRKLAAYCIDKEDVEVIAYSGEYVKVRKKDGAEGWCMSGFVKINDSK